MGPCVYRGFIKFEDNKSFNLYQIYFSQQLQNSNCLRHGVIVWKFGGIISSILYFLFFRSELKIKILAYIIRKYNMKWQRNYFLTHISLISSTVHYISFAVVCYLTNLYGMEIESINENYGCTCQDVGDGLDCNQKVLFYRFSQLGLLALAIPEFWSFLYRKDQIISTNTRKY